jgi:hypothetical protein
LTNTPQPARRRPRNWGAAVLETASALTAVNRNGSQIQ